MEFEGNFFVYDAHGWFFNVLAEMQDVCFLFNCSEEYANDMIKNNLPFSAGEYYVFLSYKGKRTTINKDE